MGDEILYEVRDGIAWLTINRPESRNALNKSARDAFGEAAHAFADDPEQLVLVITGAGDKAFCAGADLKEMADTGMRIPRSAISFRSAPAQKALSPAPVRTSTSCSGSSAKACAASPNASRALSAATHRSHIWTITIAPPMQ